MDIGQRIKQRRKELKISADELGKRLGKDRSTIYRYEKGDIENLPLDILEPIAKALSTTPQFLMGWNEEQKQSADSELSLKKQKFIKLVEGMTDSQIEKLEQILALVENTD
jgi:transcriptional regulator with XRE-family HTH domain